MTAARAKLKTKPIGNPQAFAQAAECRRTLAHTTMRDFLFPVAILVEWFVLKLLWCVARSARTLYVSRLTARRVAQRR